MSRVATGDTGRARCTKSEKGTSSVLGPCRSYGPRGAGEVRRPRHAELLVRRGGHGSASSQPFSAMLSDVAGGESTPPLYYAVAWAWSASLATARSPCVPCRRSSGHAHRPDRLPRRQGPDRAARCSGRRHPDGPQPSLDLVLAGGARLCADDVPVRGLAADVIALAGEPHDAQPRRLGSRFGPGSGHPLFRHLARWRPGRCGCRASSNRRRVAGAVGIVAAVGLTLLPLVLHQRAQGNASWIGDTPLGDRIAQAAYFFAVGPGTEQLRCPLRAGCRGCGPGLRRRRWPWFSRGVGAGAAPAHCSPWGWRPLWWVFRCLPVWAAGTTSSTATFSPLGCRSRLRGSAAWCRTRSASWGRSSSSERAPRSR